MTQGPHDDAMDQAWWDRLAGKTAGPDDEPTLLGADRLRAGLLALDEDLRQQQVARAPERAASLRHQRQQLQFAVKARAGRAAAKGDAQRTWGSWRTWGSVAIAASLLVFMVIPQQPTMDGPDDGFTVRGDDPIQDIADAHPLARAQAMAEALRQHQVTVRVHTGKAMAILEIEVPPEEFEALKPALVDAGVTPKAGLLLVRLRAP